MAQKAEAQEKLPQASQKDLSVMLQDGAIVVSDRLHYKRPNTRVLKLVLPTLPPPKKRPKPKKEEQYRLPL